MAEFASNDPFRPLLSLADQKTLKIGEKLAEKTTAMAESALLTEAKAAQARLLGEGPESSNLIDIAQSSIFQGNEVLFDAAHGRVRSAEEIQETGDRNTGVTEEARHRLVTQPQQEVIESLAAGDYFNALVGGVKAAGGTLADSARVVPEIAAGAALTVAGGSGLPVIANRINKIFGGVSNIQKAVKKAKKVQSRAAKIKQAALSIPKTASQMSVVVTDITQQQVADSTIEHGERPSNERIASMYAINMVTMTAEGGIIKQLLIPKFKKEFIKEARAVVKNMKHGSNLVSIGSRVAKGMQKALTAGGAEAAQEYAQTWADIINVGVGPNEDFVKGMKREFAGKDNRLQAMAGSFLGFGAGGVLRAGVAAPGVAAGTAVDITKGTVKTTVKGAAALTKTAGKVVKSVADRSAFQVLSKEEVDTILSDHKSKKEIVDKKVSELKSSVDTIDSATTIDTLLKDSTISKTVSEFIRDKKLTDTQLKDPKVFDGFKQDLKRSYKADIGLLKTELAASTGAAFVRQSSKNVQNKAVDTAVKAAQAVAPGVEAVIETVKDVGPKAVKKAVKAVKEIRSNTALGMIELAANAGKEEVKTILEAAKSLNKEDLQRVTAVIGEMNPDIGRKLQQALKVKDKALERSGLKRNEIINSETLNPRIADVAKRGSIDAGEVAAVSTALNETVAGNIDDISALESAEAALKAVEASEDFKQQKNGAMTRDGAVVVKGKLKKARSRLEGRPKKVKDKVVETAKKVADKVTPVLKEATNVVKSEIDKANTVKINSTFRAVTEAVVDTLKDPKLAKALESSAGDFLRQMKKFGIETRANFENFVKEFPELETNVEFFRQLDEAYPTNISADEIFDVVKTKAVDTLQQIKDAYNELNTDPACKV